MHMLDNFQLKSESTIYVAGHNGLVGSAIYRKFREFGYQNLVTASSKDLDLRKQDNVYDFFTEKKPDVVVLAAAKVGGIGANLDEPLSFISDNLNIQNSVLMASYKTNVKKVVFLGSSCVYPKLANQPIKEDSLLTGPLEDSNKPYAIAKIAGIELLKAINKETGNRHFSVMPCNLFGHGDNFSLNKSHVLAALVRKFSMAKREEKEFVELWGTGQPRREFLTSDKLAEGIIYAIQNYHEGEIINIGSGEDISIANLANLLKEISGFKGEIIWDHSKPDGTPRKVLDISKMAALGWRPDFNFEAEVRTIYDWYHRNFQAWENKK